MTVAGNVAARLGALASLLAATLLLAREGGPAVVGVFALLHVLPGLVGTVVACGLPVAVPFFIARAGTERRRLPLTIVATAVTGGILGVALWMAAAPLIGAVLFPEQSVWLVALAGTAVLTRLVVITAKACSQGSDDLPGANRVILTEELLFLPAFGLVSLAGARGATAVVLALPVADVATGSLAWTRLARRGFFAAAERPSLRLARRIAGYGLRAQLGGLITQLNLRLDFVLLGALTSPAVVGIYAIATKFAELMRLVTMALTYVLYPDYARDTPARAAARARRLLPRAGLAGAAAAAVLALAAGIVIPALYGSSFTAAVTPARILAAGLALEAVAAVITAFLYGAGRPGLNSWAMGAGLAVTVGLDLLLIPHLEAVGAAIASALAYATASMTLIAIFSRVGVPSVARPLKTGPLSRAEAR
jgi:O-antigen/teichoic acid export membrane protein